MAPWDRRHPCRPASAGRDAGGVGPQVAARTHAPLQTMPSEIALVMPETIARSGYTAGCCNRGGL